MDSSPHLYRHASARKVDTEEVTEFQSRVSALESAYKDNWPRLLRFFRMKGFSEAESEDLVQETMWRFWRSLEQTQRLDAPVTSYLLIIASNLWKNQLRRRSTLKRQASTLNLESVPQETQEFADHKPNPLEVTLSKEDRERLNSALERLTPRVRKSLLLYYLHGASYREIAARRKVSLGTVKKELHRARAILRDALFSDPTEEMTER